MRTRVTLCVAMLAVATGLVVVTTAQAATWEVKSVSLPTGGTEGALWGVSCPSTTFCAAVGDYWNGSIWGAAGDEWNGTSWTVATVEANPGDKNGDLRSVSCWSTTGCRASGAYGNKGAGNSLIEGRKEGTWKRIPSPNASNGKNPEFMGISCPETAFCLATGEFVNLEAGEAGAAFASEWEGEEWVRLSPVENPGGQKNGQLQSVSCYEVGVCMSVGGWGKELEGRFVSQAGSEIWTKSTKEWAVVNAEEPAGAKFGMFYGVSCTSATFCMAVGKWSENVSSAPYKAMADTWNGSKWTLVLWSGGSEGATEGALHSVSCTAAEECEMVGSDKSKTGVEEALAYRFKKGTWTFQKTELPVGAKSGKLEGISCKETEVCNAVGDFVNSEGKLKPFAEAY